MFKNHRSETRGKQAGVIKGSIKWQEKIILAEGCLRCFNLSLEATRSQQNKRVESLHLLVEVVMRRHGLAVSYPQTPANFSGEGRTSSKSRHRGWVSYLPAYLPAVPHVWHQWLVWRFGRLWDGDARRVLWK